MFAEKHERDLFDRARPRQKLPGGGDRDLCRFRDGVSINARADGGKCDCFDPVFGCQPQRLPMTGGQQFRLTRFTSPVDRPHRVNDVSGVKEPAPVITALPGGQRPMFARIASSSAITDGPAARWIAPSTPPPPRSSGLAAFTIASAANRVISPCARAMLTRRIQREPNSPKGSLLRRPTFAALHFEPGKGTRRGTAGNRGNAPTLRALRRPVRPGVRRKILRDGNVRMIRIRAIVFELAGVEILVQSVKRRVPPARESDR